MALEIANAIAAAQANLAADAVDAGVAAGKLIIYDGARPATADTALGAQVALVEFTMGDPAFGDAAPVTGGQTVTANAIASTTADFTGTATWFRMFDSDNNPILQGDVTNTAGAGACKLATTSLVAGGAVELVSMTYRQRTA